MSTTDPKNVKDIVTNLNAGWYNVVTEAMQVTDPNFQLAQGVLGLQTEDSSGLFLISDAVPEPAAVAYYDPSGLSKRSSAYQLLLASLLPETGTDLAGFLKDMYPSWVEYRISFYKEQSDEHPDSAAGFQQLGQPEPRSAQGGAGRQYLPAGGERSLESSLGRHGRSGIHSKILGHCPKILSPIQIFGDE